MSTRANAIRLLERPAVPAGAVRGRTPAASAGARPPGRLAPEPTPGALLWTTGALVVAACLPLARVLEGRGFFLPVFGAALGALAVNWACRRAGAGPTLSLLASVLGWGEFVALAFLSDTLLLGLLPTPATLSAGRDLWITGLELVQLRPSPAFPEPGLVLLAVNGVWAVAHAADGLVFRLRAPVAAIVMALILWTVPLAIAPPAPRPWLWALPLMVAAAALLLAFAGADLGRFGTWVDPQRPHLAGLPHTGWAGGPASSTLGRAGAALAALAILLGVVGARQLPGYDDEPWYELRGLGGTTLTSNPIVGLRQRLVNGDDTPVLRVTTPRPVYIRTTSLDLYEREEWTNGGIQGQPIGAGVPLEYGGPSEVLTVGVEVLDLGDNAVLVPLPYQTASLNGPAAERFQYDPLLSTFTVARPGLQAQDAYQAEVFLPAPTADQLRAAPSGGGDPRLTALPGNVPSRVGELARQIVAGVAPTRFDQAIAVQDELRRWTYSLTAPAGHSGTAMDVFLDSRSGYCEQFAGTMAVMLRTLGIPARVAVGFTPGTPLDPGADEQRVYNVSLANAHAWVEVLFPGYGWIAFEPTPRSDGNVLVPTAANLAPRETAVAPSTGPAASALPPSSSLEDNLSLQDAERFGAGRADSLDRARASATSPVPALLGVLAGLLGLSAVLGARDRRERAARRSPRERVLRARERVGWLGVGLGVPAGAAETDAEYLRRLSGDARDPQLSEAAGALALRAEQARWARALPEPAAGDAEAAAVLLEAGLVGHLSRPRRARAHALAALAEARDSLLAATAGARRLRRPDRKPVGTPR